MTESDSNCPFGTGATPDSRVDPARLPATLSKEEGSSGVIEHLPEYQVQKLTPEQKNGLAKAIDPNGFLHLTPMICNDQDCPMYRKCPLVRLLIARPVGEDCPVESAEIRTWQHRLFEVLPAEEKGDPYNVMLVNDIALLQLIEQRAMVKLADTGDIEQEITVGYAPDGGALKNKDIHRSLQVLERIGKRKTQLMSKLLATPQDKVKAATAGMYDRSQAAVKLVAKMEELQAKREKAKQEGESEVIEADFEVKE